MKWIIEFIAGLALLIGGVGMATFGVFNSAQDTYLAYQSQQWPKTNAQILSKTIEKYYAGSYGEIHYYYEVGGHSYFDRLERRHNKRISVEELSNEWAHYNIGGNLQVSYHPENPELSFNNTEQNNWGSRFFELFILGPGGLLVMGFGYFLVQNALGYKPAKINRPLSNYRNPLSRKKRKRTPGRMPNRR